MPQKRKQYTGFQTSVKSHNFYYAQESRFMTPYSIQFIKVAFHFKSLFSNLDIDIFNQFSNF